MNKVFFYLLFFLSPAVSIIIYLIPSGFSLEYRTISVMLGNAAFIYFANQFILAARPKIILDTIGIKKIQSLHNTMPVIILIIAFIHHSLKFGILSDNAKNALLEKGASNFFYSPDNPLLMGLNYNYKLQALLGDIVLWALLVIIILTVLLMANTFWLKIKIVKDFRDFVYKTTGLNYKKMRLFHNILVLAGLVIAVHVTLATTANLAVNPAGIALNILWLLTALILYLRYKISSLKKSPAKA